jgi:hypothetical protein
MFGKKHKEETLIKLRKEKTPEHRLKLSLARKLYNQKIKDANRGNI